MSQQSGTYSELLFANDAAYTAIASFTSEKSLLTNASQQVQPVLFPSFFEAGAKGKGRTLRIKARGILSTTGTPTYTFQVRLGSTVGPTQLGGTSVGVTAAITTQSAVTNKFWELDLDLTCFTPGQGTGACTLSGAGKILSPTGFASPFIYAVQPTSPESATWTSTVDNSLAQYLNLSVTSSASSASNTLQLLQLLVFGLN